MKTYKVPAADITNGEVAIPADVLESIATDVRDFDKTYSAAEKSARSLAVIERFAESAGRDMETLSAELRQTIRGLTIAVTKLVELMDPQPEKRPGPKPAPGGYSYTRVPKTTSDPSA